MRLLFSRYGGSSVIIGKGKASNQLLPEDQSLDNMLDHHAIQPVPNFFYLSSYRMLPEFMGWMSALPGWFVKIGVLEHEFFEILLQYDISVETHVYIGIHHYPNVFAVLISTDEGELRYLLDLGSNKTSYDYVLTFWIKGIKENEDDLKRSPEILEMILFTLVYEMGLSGTKVNFTPSKTFLGKLLPDDLTLRMNAMLSSVNSEQSLHEILKQYRQKLAAKIKDPDKDVK